MTTITKSVVSKLAVAAVATSMIFAAYAPAARAQSSEDLQKMINDLLAQVASLQSQVGQGGTSAASVCPYTWTRDLSSGAKGADVMKLQQFLNADADTRVAVEGAGSAGMETEFYGPATAAAVSKLQVKYRADILSPAALVNPTGYFGPSSRAKANSLCVTAPVVETPEDTTTDDEDTMDDEKVTLKGEASLDDVQVDTADESTVAEGTDDAAIGIITVSFKDGDAEIDRLDISLVGDGANDETNPWDTFDSVSLWVDGDKIAEVDSNSRRNDYLNDDDGSLRFSKLGLVGMEDEDVEITVAANISSGMDDSSDGEDWTLYAGALRYFDADGVATTEDEVGDQNADLSTPSNGADFSIEEAGYDDELQIKSSTNDPDSTTIKVEDNKKSGWTEIFVYDLDTKNSINDITLNNVTVGLMTGTEDVADVVDDVRIIVDGKTITDFVDTQTGVYAIYDFNVDGDVSIDAGDRVAVSVEVRFKQLDGVNYNEGETVQATSTVGTASLGYDAEGADDLVIADGDISGSATGDLHTLRTEGAVLEFVSSTETIKENSNTTVMDDQGTFTLKFDVTAFEADLYIAKTAASSTGTTDGVDFRITDGSGNFVGTTTASAALSSTASSETGTDLVSRFVVNQGETETFTVTVTYDPGIQGYYAVQLYGVNFKTANTGAATVVTQTALPASDYESDPLSI